MARDLWPKARRSSGANQRALRSVSGLFFSRIATPVRDPFKGSSHRPSPRGKPRVRGIARPDQGGGTHSRFDPGVLAGRGARPPFLVPALQKPDIDLGAVDADELASAIGQAGGGQQQKELLEIEALNRAFDGEDGVVVRYGLEQAIAAPRSIDAHDADAIPAAEGHAFRCLAILGHWSERPHRSARCTDGRLSGESRVRAARPIDTAPFRIGP